MKYCNTALMRLVFAAILLSCFSPVVAMAQLQGVKSIPLEVNYSQTVHLVFPSVVKYYESVSEYVVCESPVEAPNIVRIKANTEDFTEHTNVSVATEEGNFYTFDVSYKRELPTTYYRYLTDTLPQPPITTIAISDAAQTHIVFPQKIVYLDFGDEMIEGRKAENTENILRLRATKQFSGISNVSLTTQDGTFYTYNLVYKQAPKTLLYRIEGEQQVILTDNRINSRDKGDLIKRMTDKKQSIYNIGVKTGGMLFSIENLAVYKDALIFVVSIKNNTAIPYDIDYIRYSIADKKVGKLTASQEEERTPMFGSNHTTKRIEAKSTLRYIVAFDKFSLANDKVFRFEINEAGGGRHILFDLDDQDLQRCERL